MKPGLSLGVLHAVEEASQYLFINVREGIKIFRVYYLIDLMDSPVQGSQFYNLRTRWGDKAPIGSTPVGRQAW